MVRWFPGTGIFPMWTVWRSFTEAIGDVVAAQ